MIVPRVHRPRRTAPLAALLLVIQGIAGGVVPLAHASERFTAPAHIEAQHGSGCLALHDELRCVLCHYAPAARGDHRVRAAARAVRDRPDRLRRSPHRPTPRSSLAFVADPASLRDAGHDTRVRRLRGRAPSSADRTGGIEGDDYPSLRI